MKCHVLLFAQLREKIGADHLTIDLPEGATVNHAIQVLCAQHQLIADLRSSIAVAIDERYRSTDFLLTDGCTIALIPPVSGG